MGELLGTAMLPRKAGRLLWDHGWVNAEMLALTLATMMAESDLFPWAYNWNDPDKGGNGTTDWGWMQLNDGNVGGKKPIVANGKPHPVAGGSKSLADLNDFAAVALDPALAVVVGRDLYNRRKLTPWFAGPDYEHASNTAWKRHYPTACYAVKNMLLEMRGFPIS